MSTETGLALLRKPFPPHHISKLPKPTKQQTEEVKADYKKGIRCQICGTWHHPNAVHLDYVGHAALTDRLLDADPAWTWEPLAMSPEGLPVLDPLGGMWIRLTVCGVTRLGYGHAGEKTGGDAIKEVIGDALRNAAMRFGAALDLWHKGDLHKDEEQPQAQQQTTATPSPAPAADVLGIFPSHAQKLIRNAGQKAIEFHAEGKEWAAYEEYSTLLNKLGGSDEVRRNQVREALNSVVWANHPNLRNKMKDMSQQEYSNKETA